MPDLITHGAVALLVKAGTGRPHVASFIAGSLLPDLLARVPPMLMERVDRHLVAIPRDWLYVTSPMHMPIGMLVSAYALSFLFQEAERRAVFWSLLGGMGLHLALDLTQYHLGVGNPLFFPINLHTYELGWIGSETTVPIAIPLALLSVWVYRRRRRGRPDQTDQPDQKGISA